MCWPRRFPGRHVPQRPCSKQADKGQQRRQRKCWCGWSTCAVPAHMAASALTDTVITFPLHPAAPPAPHQQSLRPPPRLVQRHHLRPLPYCRTDRWRAGGSAAPTHHQVLCAPSLPKQQQVLTPAPTAPPCAQSIQTANSGASLPLSGWGWDGAHQRGDSPVTCRLMQLAGAAGAPPTPNGWGCPLNHQRGDRPSYEPSATPPFG